MLDEPKIFRFKPVAPGERTGLSKGDLRLFASFMMDIELVAQIVRWDMTVLRESPWYQEILQKGMAEGEQKGKAEGERSLILRLLTRRLGTLPASIGAQVEALALPQLEALGEALLDFSGPADLDEWLRSQR